jgi:hypothetical protein
MKRELDADFVLKAKERAVARAVRLRADPHSLKVIAKGEEFLREYQRQHSAQKKAYA